MTEFSNFNNHIVLHIMVKKTDFERFCLQFETLEGKKGKHVLTKSKIKQLLW